MRCIVGLVLVLVISIPSLGETVTFTETVRVVMGSRESQDEVRVYATQEAKRRVLDKVGVYLSGSTEVVRRVRESVGQVSNLSPHNAERQVSNLSPHNAERQVSNLSPHNAERQVSNLSPHKTDGLKTRPTDTFSDTTDVLQRIQTLTVGVVRTEVAQEEWKTEGVAVVLYLVCRVILNEFSQSII